MKITIKRKLNILLSSIGYYRFILKIHKFTYLAMLFFCGIYLIALNSSVFKDFSGSMTLRYVFWKYGSIEHLDLLTSVEKFDLLQSIAFFWGIFAYLITLALMISSQIYVVRSVSFRDYEIRRTGKLLDDIGFWGTFTTLCVLLNNSLIQLFDYSLYKLLCTYVSSYFILHILIKFQSYDYLVRKRSKLLKT